MPQIGLGTELTAALVWAAATRTLSAFAAQDLFLLPAKDDIYVTASPISSASADTYGSWVQLSANIGAGRVLVGIVVFSVTTLTAGGNLDLQIGEGASSSEAAVETVNLPGTGTNYTVFIPLWRALTDSARISVRAKDSIASAITYRVAIITVG